MILDLKKVVVMKTPIDLFYQFGCSLQVDLGGMDIHVSHIGCQPRKPGINILSVTVPGQQPVNRKGVPDVMDARAGALAVRNAALSQQVPEGLVDGALMQASGLLVNKERRIGGEWSDTQAFTQVLLKGLGGRSAHGYPSSLSELAFGYVEALLGTVEEFQVQG